MTKDKEDFLENIKLAYKVVYKGSIFSTIFFLFLILILESFMNIITKYWEKFKWTEEKKKKLKNSFEAEDKILVGAYEVFLMFFDEESEEEFADTANRFLKIK